MTTNEATSTENTETKPLALAEGQKLAGCYLLQAKVVAADPAGAGELWLANDDVLGRDISLQFVADKIRQDPKAVADVRQEIKRNRQLIHPNILRVYDFIEESDWAAVSMDAFEGESLASRMGQRSSRVFSVAEIEPWVMQLCETLEEAHKIGLFHRDISPANIYFRPDGRLFLVGFGYSRCVADALRRLNGNDNTVSANLSPQLLDGQPAARTDDVYACGALLFELLTGHAPFSGAEIANQIRNAAPKTVGELRSKDLEPVPENWERAIASCLSKNPAERPSGAAKLAERLTAAPVSETSVLEMLTPAPEEAKEAVAEHKAAEEMKAPSEASNELKESKESAASEAPASAAPPSFALGRRNISVTSDPAAPSTAPAAKSVPEKTPLSESNIPPKTSRTTRPKTVKPDAYSSVYGNRQGSPIMGKVLMAAVLLLAGLLGYHFLAPNKENPPEKVSDSTPAPSQTGETPPPVNSHGSNPPGDDGKSPVSNGNSVAGTPGADGTGKTGAPGATPITGQIRAPKPTPPQLPASASPAEKALAQKQAELEKAKQAVAAAEKAVADLTKQQQTAETEAAAAQKALDEKTKGSIGVKKVVDELLAKKKKLEADQKAADDAALQARQAADEKQRLAETAKQAADDFAAKNQDKLASVNKADSEIAEIKKTVEDKQQAAATAAKTRADAEAERVRQAANLKASEQQVADAAAKILAARQASEDNANRLKNLDAEAKKLREEMQKQLEEIERQRNNLLNGLGNSTNSTPAPSAATPPPIIPSTPAKIVPTATPLRSTPVALITPIATPSLNLSELAPLPKPATPDPVTMAKLDGPKVTIDTNPGETPPVVGNGVNSLGEKFVPVGDVDFCIWQTRVKDFEAFARAVGLKSVGWRSPGFKQGPDHPVVNVTWLEAIAFCKWLTDKEHKEGSLPANQFYRLPTDLEWSKAVGLPPEPEKSPAERDMVITDVYPWGKDWPPPAGAGNYTGEETGSDVAIKGFNDGFAWTSPVGSFKPNKYGIYDMGGNVWQWCMDSWNDKSTGKVLRGASWYNGALKLSLLSSCRVHAAPDSSTDNYGFRIVKATEATHASKK